MTVQTQPGSAPQPAGRGGGYDAQTHQRLAAESREIMARYPQARSALLPMLHLVQAQDGYVSRNGIVFCAQMLSLTPAEVSAVATFYSMYKRRPNGEYTVGVCTNTLCAIMGGDEIFAELSEHLGIGNDETTEDGTVTLERIECNAACDYAPVMMVNWEFFDDQTPASATAVVDDLRAGKDVTPTRGASSVCSFKAMSRVLAGFPDGRADEGAGAGHRTTEGTRLAREHGWTAPDGAPAVEGQQEDGLTPDASTDGDGVTGDGATRSERTTTNRDEPGTGEERSSAQRPTTTPADSSPDTTTSTSKVDDGPVDNAAEPDSSPEGTT